ncbi:Armadillo repeat only 4 [Hibiscus syriacus]|uniref:Armadillo repeat only 4 n=1 Tax=Hibiscus syriacus TaxID=106335 RepID=A0A6A3A3F4_HIBSY|nr:Armadillo repeat only 4 [Hibiscus syriacus]
MKIFSKYLTETDRLKRLSIPSRVLSSFPEFNGGHAVELLVTYETVEWPLVCTVRRQGRYKKPVLSKGWRRFVLGNGLNVGDRITFHKEEDELSSLHYRVELERAASRGKKVQVKREPKQSDLPNVGGGELVDSNGRANDCAKQETAAALLEHFGLGLTAGGNTVVRDRHSCNTSFYRTDQILGQPIHGNFVDLDLTLGHRYC